MRLPHTPPAAHRPAKRRRPLARLRARARVLVMAGTVAAGMGGNADAAGGAVPEADPPPHAQIRVVREGAAIVRGDDVLLTARAWQAWADAHLAREVRTPLAIGPVRLRVRDFDRFGVAVADPEAHRILFTVTGYAVATTLSLIGVLDPDAGIAMLPEGRMGDLHDVAWAPQGDLVAYAVATARASGEGLHVDDVRVRRTVLSLERQDLSRAVARACGLPEPGPDDANAYLPHVRDTTWELSGGRLAFRIDPPLAAGEAPRDPDRPREPALRATVEPREGGLRIPTCPS